MAKNNDYVEQSDASTKINLEQNLVGKLTDKQILCNTNDFYDKEHVGISNNLSGFSQGKTQQPIDLGGDI